MKKCARFICLIVTMAAFSSSHAASEEIYGGEEDYKCKNTNHVDGPIKINHIGVGFKRPQDENAIVFCTDRYVSSSKLSTGCFSYKYDVNNEEFSLSVKRHYRLLLTAFAMQREIYFYCTHEGWADHMTIKH